MAPAQNTTKHFSIVFKESSDATLFLPLSLTTDIWPGAQYFSTLERLRFAQNSRSNGLHHELPQNPRRSSIADRRGVSNHPIIEPKRKNSSGSHCRHKSRLSLSGNEASWFLALPEKIRRREFSREEQVALAASNRDNVILDAADEALYKNSRRAGRQLAPLQNSSLHSNSRPSMDTRRPDSSSSMAAAIYESFRWMDEEEDLNLKLVLDDYHANLDGAVIPKLDSDRRPSFRRQMSVSKMPFARNSMSSIQPLSPKAGTASPGHSRSRSRAMSLIAPKHAPQSSVSSIDPHATHYQDPEARLKLRVYLASPQKFDEAIEFGFPSLDGVTDAEKDKENRRPMHVRNPSSFKQAQPTEKSFLDDTVSLFEDDASMVDPDSPVTPMHTDTHFKSHQYRSSQTYLPTKSGKNSMDLLTRPPMRSANSESYAQAMAGSREMTLRMTLTRPDLRADESQLYGWQTRKSHSQSRDGPILVNEEDRYEVRGPFGGVDGWGPPEREGNGIRRLWKKVKHPGIQRKTTT